MITAFAGSPLSNQFHETNWRWAYGTICIILPIIALPLIITWELAKRKADKEGRLHYKPKIARTFWESFTFYFIEFDGGSTGPWSLPFSMFPQANVVHFGL